MERIKQYKLPIIIIFISLSFFLARQLYTDPYTDKTRLDEHVQDVSLEALLEMEVPIEGEVEQVEREIFPLLVDVKGAVVLPGVYELKKGERVDHAIKRAGGLTAEADVNAVNFAQHVSDEMVIYVPVQGEEVSPYSFSLGAVEQQENQLIDINTADITALLELNGIGPQKAQSIIEHRETNGRFNTIDELTEVSGIGLKTLEKIQNQITAN